MEQTKLSSEALLTILSSKGQQIMMYERVILVPESLLNIHLPGPMNGHRVLTKASLISLPKNQTPSIKKKRVSHR
jgi:hypothetical protein